MVPAYARPDVRKNVRGYYNAEPLDVVDLFIGSEGTLGVITEIELRLLRKPEGFFSGVVFFKDEADLLAFVDESRDQSYRSRVAAFKPHASGGGTDTSASVDASLLEYFDDKALGFISEKFP